MNRLVQWDPFRVHVDGEAVAALLRHRAGSKVALTFTDGAIVATAAGMHARVTLVATTPRELRLSVAVQDGRPAIVVTLSLDALLPGFVDVTIAGAEITKEGVFLSLGPGGADPPS
jgi:hypothetical protein